MITSKELFQRIRRIEIKTSRLVEEFLQGMYRSVFKGRGVEFEEVRLYQTGDDLRSIDWNVTARMGFPYVKSFREERELTVFLLVDISASLKYGTVSQLKKDLIAEVAAVLAFSAIKNNDKVGMILFTDRIEKYIPPKKGLRHVLRIIRDLLAFEPKGKGTSLKNSLSFLGKLQRKTAVTFLLSDFISKEDYRRELKLVSRHHDLIAIHVFDPKEVHFPNLGMIAVKNFETGEEMILDTSDSEIRERFLEHAQLRQTHVKQMMGKLNAGYVELTTDKPYLSAIRKYFRAREKRV